MLLFRLLNPHALKGKNKNQLLVFWCGNRRMWVTAAMFIVWLNNCFVFKVEKYLDLKKHAFKVLLILDNAPSHPESLQFVHPRVEVILLPANMTSLLQQMVQGLIATFKSHDTCDTLEGLLAQMDIEPCLTMMTKKNPQHRRLYEYH